MSVFSGNQWRVTQNTRVGVIKNNNNLLVGIRTCVFGVTITILVMIAITLALWCSLEAKRVLMTGLIRKMTAITCNREFKRWLVFKKSTVRALNIRYNVSLLGRYEKHRELRSYFQYVQFEPFWSTPLSEIITKLHFSFLRPHCKLKVGISILKSE